MPDLGIVMLHHRDDSATRSNLDSFQRHHPGAAVISVSGNVPLPGGVCGRDLTVLGRRWSEATNGGVDRYKSWHNCDLLLYSWYLEREVECAQWLVVEWDVFCNCPARKFYGPLWTHDFVAPRVHRPASTWPWFTSSPPPPDLHPFRLGVAPLCALLLSDRALDAISTFVASRPDFDSFCELRIGTAANYVGFPPVSNARGWTTLLWAGDVEVHGRALFHPVKTLLGPS